VYIIGFSPVMPGPEWAGDELLLLVGQPGAFCIHHLGGALDAGAATLGAAGGNCRIVVIGDLGANQVNVKVGNAG
jgi:hypothetical protein